MRRFLALCSIACATACAWDSSPPPPPTVQELARSLLTEFGAPGSFEITILPEANYGGTASNPPVPNVDLARLPFGDRELLATPEGFLIHERGRITRTTGGFPEVPKGPVTARTKMWAMGDRVLAVRCMTTTTIALALVGTSWTPVSGATDWCARLVQFGEASGDRVALLFPSLDGKTLNHAAYTFAGDTLAPAGAEVVETLAAPAPRPIRHEEVSPGVFAALRANDKEWTYTRTDGKTLTIPAKGVSIEHVRRRGTTLEIVAGVVTIPSVPPESWWRWDVDGDGSIVEAGTVDPADGGLQLGTTFGEAYGTKLGADAAPQALLRTEQGTALDLVPVPTTPCSSRADCMRIGDSRFVGPLTGGYGAYVVWTWRGAIAVWAAPLAGRTVP